MAWCFSTRAALAIVLIRQPYASIWLWVNQIHTNVIIIFITVKYDAKPVSHQGLLNCYAASIYMPQERHIDIKI